MSLPVVVDGAIKVTGYKTSNDSCTVYFWTANTLTRELKCLHAFVRYYVHGKTLSNVANASAIKRAQTESRADCKKRLCGAEERRKSAYENRKSAQFDFLSNVFSATTETCAFSTTAINTISRRYALTKFTLARPEISIACNKCHNKWQ